MKLVQGKIFLLPVVAAALVACGGGSDSPPPPETITLTGTVAKGVVSGAKMRVLSAAASPVVLASGFTTDANGRYTIKLNKTSGPVVIEADLDGADIADETNPDVPYKGKPGEKMRAIISPTASAADATANVTPFSEMAVDLVADAGWEAKAVNDANRIVRQLLNNTDHLTASPTAGALLASLTAVQQLVNSTEGGLTAVLSQLRDAAGGGDGSVSIDSTLVDALDAACGTTTACADAFDTPDPIVIGTGDLVDPVYGLFQDLRDTLLAYSNETQTGELDVAAVKLDEAVKAAVQPIDDEMLGVLAMFAQGDELYRDFKASNTAPRTVTSGSSYGRIRTFNSGGAVADGFLPKYRCELASATIATTQSGATDVNAYTTEDLTSANVNVFSCYGFGTAGRLYPARDGVNSYWHSVTFIPQGGNSFKYVHQLRTQPFDQSAPGSASTRVKAVYGDLGVTRNASSDLTGFNLSGKLVPGLQGHAAGEYATLDRVDAMLSFASTEPTATSARFDLSGEMTLYKTGNVFASSVEIASGSMASAKTDVPFSYTDYQFGGESCPIDYSAQSGSTAPNLWCIGTITEIGAEISELKLDVTVTAPGVRFQGIVNADTPSFDSTQTEYIPTKVSLQGKIFEADGTGFRLLLDGAGSVELLNYASFDATGNTAAPVKVGFDGKVLLKNRPEMRLTLSGERTEQRAQSLSGTFFWNSKALKFAAATNGDWTISNDAGVRFTIPEGESDVAQDVFLGDAKVGTVNFGQSRIEYADGRFQQF